MRTGKYVLLPGMPPMSSRIALLGVVCLVMAATAPLTPAAPPVAIHLKATDAGRVFQGVGAVSAGASTRLLYDYEEPYRGDILDFLFKPGFGAGFQHLKVEIGGGENSTCGSEPSHAITREELAHPKARGYEFWLMSEARRRNPRVMLDCLPWSYPGCLRGRFSQDASDWFVAFLEVARKEYGMNVDWVAAAQNENGTDRDWIVQSVRPTLDRRGFRSVKIQAPDCDKGFWQVFDEFEKDAAYRDVIEAVGYHYVNGREPWFIDQVSRRDATPKAKASGKQLWASEEWSMSGGKWDGTGALFLARLINKLYIRDRISKTEIWCPIASIYAGLPWSDTGAMQADAPWSGHYAVWPAIWAVAHTTQFARPGWQYLDGGCGQIDPKTWKGTYVTLKDPATGDWSMIVCTGDPSELRITVGEGLKAGPVRVWKSDANRQFSRQGDVIPADGTFTVTLDGNSVYSLTTTTGQRKGEVAHAVPAARPFPLPYRDDLESYVPGQTPRYFSDQKGTFEVWDEPGHGKCLKQIVPQQGIMWQYMRGIVKPYTVIGDQKWADYCLSADVRIVGGDVELGGRFGDQNRLSYRWVLSKDGSWKLKYQERTLATGVVEKFDASAWHSMKLVLRGTTICGYIDGQRLADVKDSSRSYGMPYLASTYHGNLFDNVTISNETSSLAAAGDVRGGSQRAGEPRADSGAAFVRVSPRDPRYFELSDGTPYIPIGLNLVGPPGSGLAGMETWLRKLSANGGNYARIWLSNPFFDVEHGKSGRYDSERAKRIDDLLALARKYGIRLKLCTEHFRHLGEGTQTWAGKPQHLLANGGPARDTADFFKGEAGRRQYKSKLAWYADRYRDEPMVFGWELWNEMNAVRVDVWRPWSAEMLPELHRLFPKNLAMQSLGSFDREQTRDSYRDLCELPGNDVLQVHRYLDQGASWDICHGPVAVFAAEAVGELRSFGVRKPVLLAESGAVEPRHSGPSKLYAKDREGMILHDVLFAPFFAGAAGPGHIWHWDVYVDRNDLWHHFGRFAAVVKGLDPPAESLEPFELPHPRLLILGLRGRHTTLLWCRDRQNTWRTELVEGKPPELLRQIRVDLGPEPTSPPARTIQTYDPWSNVWRAATLEGSAIMLPEFRRSLVIRLKR